MPIRIILDRTFASVEVADANLAGQLEQEAAFSAEPGCTQFELYRSVSRPERFTVLEQWVDQPLYDRHWALQKAQARRFVHDDPVGRGVEFYRHQRYEVVDGVWVPADVAARSEAVRWA